MSDSEEEEVKKVYLKPQRYFISNVLSNLGRVLVKKIMSDARLEPG